MTYGTFTAKYLENDVLSRSREMLIPLMYEHLLAHLRRAKIQIEQKDLEGKGESIGRATTIVTELLATLDMERGGEIANRLAALYTFFSSELLRIGKTLDLKSLEKITVMVSDLHESWLAIAKEQAGRIPDGRDSLYERRR